MQRPLNIWLCLFAMAAVAAAICVPIVLFMHHALMPSATELQQLDELVRKQVSPSSHVQRLGAPDRIDQVGDVKTGYFNYIVKEKEGNKKFHVDWRIERGKVEVLSVKGL